MTVRVFAGMGRKTNSDARYNRCLVEGKLNKLSIFLAKCPIVGKNYGFRLRHDTVDQCGGHSQLYRCLCCTAVNK